MFKTKNNHAFVGAMALFLLAIIYGFMGYFSRELAPGLSLWQQTYIRLGLGAPLLYLTFRKKIDIGNCIDAIKKEPWLIGLRSLCLYVVSVPLYFYATQNAKLGNAAFLQVLPYIFILGVIINKEKLTRQKVVLMLIALSGAYLIAVKSGLDLSSIGKGEIASVVSGLLFSLGFVTRKKHKSKANNYELSFILIAVSVVALLALSIVSGDGIPRPASTSLHFFIILAVAGYLNAGIALLANYGFRYVKDTFANNIMALEGTFGVLAGYLIYKEVPTARESIGALIILAVAIASTYLVSEKEPKQQKELNT
jgi:drug/metabolite transporter (DMT)-like permease